jgi:hypothetical protein
MYGTGVYHVKHNKEISERELAHFFSYLEFNGKMT